MASTDSELTVTPDKAMALASDYLHAGRLEEAEALYLQILRHIPDHPDALHLLGVVADQKGDGVRAVELIERALTINPKNAEAHNNLGMAWHACGDSARALACFQRATQLDPAYAQAWYCVGWMQKRMGNIPLAIAAYERAVALAPQFAQAHYNLGNLYLNTDEYDKAQQAFTATLALQPSNAQAFYNLGLTYYGQGRMPEAHQALQRGLALAPNIAIEILDCIMAPAIPPSQDAITACREAARNGLLRLLQSAQASPAALREYGQTNFFMAYHGRNDRELQMLLAQLYLKICPDLAWVAPHCRTAHARDNSSVIRLGIVSSHLLNHTVGKLMRGIIEHFPRDRFEVHLFTFPGKDDPLARRIQSAADSVSILPRELVEAREKVAAGALDIIFYPDIGMDAFTYFLAFARLAPVQCVGWGHPVTTGIPNLDYFISSRLIEPEDAQDHYCERLVCLPALPVYYDRPDAGPFAKSREDFGLSDDAHLYICPQSLFKLHPEFDAMLLQILEQDPRATIVLIAAAHPYWTKLLTRRLA